MISNFFAARRGATRFVGATLALILLAGAPAQAQSTAFSRALAEAAAPDDVLAGFYRQTTYATLWTGPTDASRRAALLQALADAPDQGLPLGRYDRAGLISQFHSVVTEGDRGRLEAAMSRAFLSYAGDLTSGVLIPAKVDAGILREISHADPVKFLSDIAGSPDPAVYLRDLAPDAPEYARLVKEKLRLEDLVAKGGWGPKIEASQLSPGATGPAVLALRDRLVALGYLAHGAQASYDAAITRAVQRYQLDNGISASGEAGESTIAALNTPPEDRLRAVVVALERLRWMGETPRGARHIWVNQPDFTAKIVDDGRTVFQTRVVIGKNVPDQRSPEFSDQMEFMVINPSWGVPRSILVKEYLPLLQRNPNAVGHLDVVDGNGRIVPRGAVNFAAYSASSFPFGLRQAPSDGNALGKVKFMFPNPYNIYLHDTPAKNLFANEVRAYSHGCIRVGDPVDLAYALLARQTDDPKGLFQHELATKRETNVSLDTPVPVHLVYFTAWPTAKGQIGYRNDIYGRDARIFEALTAAGVVLGAERG